MSRQSHGRDDPGTGQKAILAAGVVGLAGWLFYQFVWKPSHTPPGTGPSPTPPGPPQPGPGPGSIGDAAVQGDTILVSSSALASLLGSAASLPSHDVEMIVTGAAPGSPVVLAQTTGKDGAPAGVSAPVPRNAITMVSHTGPTPPPDVPRPGNLPGPIPGLPNVIPPTPVDLGNPMNLQNGHHYRARVELGTMDRLFLGNAAAIKSMLEGQGFTDVQVFHGNSDPLPADWPLMTIAIPISDSTWFGQGTWGAPSGPVARPPQIIIAWEQ